jgi:hypothetical protein
MALSADQANLGEEGFADSAGVKIHYVARGAGHWVHLGPVQAQGAPDLVTRRMVSWLTQEW